MKMKNTLRFVFVTLGFISFISCNKNNTQPAAPTSAAPPPTSGTVLTKWTLTLNGQTYSWQGNYPNTSNTSQLGVSGYAFGLTPNVGLLSFSSDPPSTLQWSINKLGMSAAGSYTFNQANYSPTSVFGITPTTSSVISNMYGGSVTVNITTFPANSVASGVSQNVLVIGNFSGTLGNPPAPAGPGGVSTISGSFEAVRLQ